MMTTNASAWTPSTVAGRIMFCSHDDWTPIVLGNSGKAAQPNTLTPDSVSRSVTPTTTVGIDTSTTTALVITTSANEWRNHAARTPSVMPNTTWTSIAASASRSVFGAA